MKGGKIMKAYHFLVFGWCSHTQNWSLYKICNRWYFDLELAERDRLKLAKENAMNFKIVINEIEYPKVA